MNFEELSIRLKQIEPSAEVAQGKQYTEVVVEPAVLHAFAKKLKETPDLAFDYMFCLSGVDFNDHFKVVYHLQSTKTNNVLVLKVKISDRNNPQTDSLSDLYETAELNEREVYDLFGIKFLNHRDLRRILLPEDWIGYPLRKDYKDEFTNVAP